jgi:hypothetical protein
VTTFSVSFKLGTFNSLSLHAPVYMYICVCICIQDASSKQNQFTEPTNPYVAALLHTDQWCHLLCHTWFCAKGKCLQQENEVEKTEIYASHATHSIAYHPSRV